jgi:WD40 repeat protein
VALAELLRAGVSRLEPTAEVFFSPASLGAGFWLPKLADGIADADAFLLLIGPEGIGPWQEVEYYTAFDRHVRDSRFPLVPVIAAGHDAPGLPLLRNLNWVEAPVVTDDKVLHRLIAALKGESVATATPLWKLVNPYRGLEAMTEANADYFHGRTAETATVLGALSDKPGRCPILIGASGVGKSSVAQAGVLSALKAMRWPGANDAAAWPRGLENSRGWVVLTMRPGDTPIAALVAAVTRLWGLDARDPDQAALPRKWAGRLAAGDNTLSDLIGATQEQLKKREGEAPARLLLYLDQGEELYTRATPQEARRFSELLTEGLGDRRLLAFASLRADYFDRLQADEALFACREHVDVPPLDRARLYQVVTAPAAALGVAFEHEDIANRITKAAADEPGALPLLSYLLTDMWAGMVKRGEPVLRLPSQAIDVGGVPASRAEEFLKDHPDREAALRRLLTLRLAIVPSEGEPVRRQAVREECTEAEWTLAAGLADHPWRLVVMGERQTDNRIIAEVAHEALLRAWPRLAHWLREERDFLVFKGEAERAERRWQAMQRADQALLHGLDLARAEEWLPTRSDDLSPEVTAFVQRSIAADRAAKQRQLRFQRRVSYGALAAAFVMAIIGVIAWMQWVEADRAKSAAVRERDNATAAEARAEAELEKAQTTQSLFLIDLARQQRTAGDAGAALLLALQALPDAAAGIARPYVPDAELALDGAWHALRDRIVLAGGETVLSAAFSPDGKLVVTTSDDKTARLWDAETGQAIGAPLTGHDGFVHGAAFSPDGKRVVTASADKTARLWDAATGRPIGAPLEGHKEGVNSVAFSPDGKRIVTASDDQTARLWDAATGQPIGAPLASHEGGVNSAAFSPDGRRIVTASDDQTARLWDTATGQPINLPLKGHDDSVRSAAFSPDGRRIVTASADKTARLWNAATGQPLGTPLDGHEGRVNSAAFSPDGQQIITASWDGTTRLWAAATGLPIGAPLRGHEGFVYSAAFSPDGRRIATASRDGTTRLWSAGNPTDASLEGHEEAVMSAAFSLDGNRIVTASSDKTARLWNAATGQPIGAPLKGHEGSVSSAAFSADGRRVVTASLDKTARLWDAETGRPLGAPLKGHDGFLYGAAFSPDGGRIVTASSDKTARQWDAATGQPIGPPLQAHEGSVRSAAFSPDGKRIVTASDDQKTRLWDAMTGQPIGAPLEGHEGSVSSAAFSPDGKRILTASDDRMARLWDAATGQPIGAPLEGHEGSVSSAAFSPDGKRIVTASSDMTARLWDAATGQPIAEPLKGHEDSVQSAAFSPDGRRIVTASADKAVRQWEVFANTQEFVAQAKATSPRCLSPARRIEFFLPPEPPSWCIELKRWPYHTPAWQTWLADTRAGKNPPLPSR